MPFQQESKHLHQNTTAAPPKSQKNHFIDASTTTATKLTSPLQSVYAARSLHQRLLQTPLLEQKQKLAREIAGVLFTAEANSALSNRARILFLRLRTLAHVSALPDSTETSNLDLWREYDELESLM